MANNPFSDFSALKSLKKELEKQDDVQNLSCTWNPYGDGATAVTVK